MHCTRWPTGEAWYVMNFDILYQRKYKDEDGKCMQPVDTLWITKEGPKDEEPQKKAPKQEGSQSS